ncbi:MAG: hypothetical protein N3G80_04110 [Candidatus Micrarchaeota archaeon]|nr:hypothetical protein [Candidatus Micrarchaeota archaeon]
MPAIKQQPPAEQSLLSFIPQGLPRTAAEYLVSGAIGGLVYFGFFILVLGLLFFIKDNNMALIFLPLTCVIPPLTGALSALVFERVRNRPLSLKSAAAVGAIAGLLGSSISSLVALLASFFAPPNSVFSLLQPLLLFVALAVLAVVDSILAALGAAVVAHITKS